MNSPLACFAVVMAAGLTALVPAQPPEPSEQAAEPGVVAPPPDSLAAWRERAERAQAWVQAKATDAEQATAVAIARARRELLGVEAPVAEPTLAVAAMEGGAKGTLQGGTSSPVLWERIGEHRFAIPQAEDQLVVLLVHGLDEPGTIWDELTPHLLEHGAIVIRFDYPNDQAIAESAKNLAAGLRRLRNVGVERVSIVGHSMGGLVSREVLTSEDGYAGDCAQTEQLPAVERLIMCGTPNHGAPLGSWQAVAEAREQVVRRYQGTAAEGAGWLGFSGDGKGEAGADLCAGSEFLTQLNARPLPKRVQLTTICGVMTPAKACEYLNGEASTQWAGFLGAERAKALTAQACAAVETLGDGMVPASSTRLEGVADHVEIAADHRSMLKRWTILNKLDELRGVKTPPAEAIPFILDRLGLEPVLTEEPREPNVRAE